MSRNWRAYLARLALLSGMLLTVAWACSAQEIVGKRSRFNLGSKEGRVSAGLAGLGFAVVPSPYGEFLSFEGSNQSELSFFTAQVGGGVMPRRLAPLYLEGYVAYQDYAPDFVIEVDEDSVEIPLRWRSYSATGGVGWTFNLAEDFTFRPVLNVAVARFSNKTGLLDAGPGTVIDFITGEGLWAGGLGASALLEYRTRKPHREIDLVARYSFMELVPLGELSDVNASATASTLSGFARQRVPVKGWRAFGQPVRFVSDLGVSVYTGDQGDLLNLPWQARVGTGFELAHDRTRKIMPYRSRVMLRYVFGPSFGGLNLGIGFSF